MSDLLKLLVVDDEPLARRRILSFDLNRHGFEMVGEAENGEEALALVFRCRPDIVVTDIVMPVMDGIQFLEALQKHPNPPKVVLLTCYDDFSKAQAALRLGAQDYLVKVLLKEEEFVETIQKVARVISREKQALRKAVRKTVYDLMLSESPAYSGENIRQLEDMNFLLEHFRILLLEFDPIRMQTMEAYKFSIEKWEGNLCCLTTAVTAKQWVVLLYTHRFTAQEFDTETRIFCDQMAADFLSSTAVETPGFHMVIGRVCTGIEQLSVSV